MPPELRKRVRVIAALSALLCLPRYWTAEALVLAADHARPRPLPRLRLRPPSHPRPLPRVRTDGSADGGGMKRLFRWASAIVLVASLLLCVSVCALWVRSFVRHDRWRRGTEEGEIDVESRRGRLMWSRFRWIGDDSPPPVWDWLSDDVYYFAPRDEESPWRMLEWSRQSEYRIVCVLGVEWKVEYPDDEAPASYTPLMVAVPHWLIAGLFAALPARFALRGLRRRRIAARGRKGFCPSCGYDMRATSARCPECGLVPGRKGVMA